MFLIAVDDSGRLVVKRGPKRNSNNHQSKFCLPTVADSSSSLRVPAKIFRTIRTLTDSAVFVEVQSGPFTDSDTEWQL